MHLKIDCFLQCNSIVLQLVCTSNWNALHINWLYIYRNVIFPLICYFCLFDSVRKTFSTFICRNGDFFVTIIIFSYFLFIPLVHAQCKTKISMYDIKLFYPLGFLYIIFLCISLWQKKRVFSSCQQNSSKQLQENCKKKKKIPRTIIVNNKQIRWLLNQNRFLLQNIYTTLLQIVFILLFFSLRKSLYSLTISIQFILNEREYTNK